MPLTLTLDTTTPRQVTVNMTGLPSCTREYTSPRWTTGSNWSNADGWTASSGMAISALQDGLRLTATGAAGTAYITRTVAAGAGQYRRVRARVRATDPEGRPVKVMLGTPSGPLSSSARMVSGTPVILESYLTATDTSVRLYVDKPAGAADGRVILEAVIFDQVGSGFLSWYLSRADASTPGGYTADPGAVVLASASSRLGGFAVDPDASGALALVDREASLVGPVRYKLHDSSSTVTADGTLTSDGYAALSRVGSSTIHRVWLQDFRGNRPGRAQALDVVGAEAPNVPLAPLGSRSGPLVMHFDTFDAAALVEADLATGQVHQLRQDDATRTTMDAYLVATDLALERVSGTEDTPTPLWAVTCTYQETARGAYL